MALCTVAVDDAPRLSRTCSVPEAAEELWRALHRPVRISWEVPLEGGHFVAAVTAKLCQESTWPPSNLQLQLHCKDAPCASNAARKPQSENALEIQVPSCVSTQQLAELLTASCALAGTKPGVVSESSTPPASPASDVEKKNPSRSQSADPTASAALDVIDRCEERRISQLQCLKQWHHDVCGHHALFNLRCLLRNELDNLRDEQRFWRQVIADIQRLATFGEVTGSWPRSRVVCGVADEVHLRHLVQQDEDLRGHITLASSIDSLKDQLNAFQLSLGQSHGFLLGAATHWYSAAVVLPHEKSEPRIYFFDSYNVPVVRLKTNEDIEELVEELLMQSRNWSMERLQRDPYWAHRPKNDIELAVEKGVEEWWKGVRKASMFWRHKPLEVRRELKRMDLFLVRDFLQLLLGWLRQ